MNPNADLRDPFFSEQNDYSPFFPLFVCYGNSAIVLVSIATVYISINYIT